MIADRESDKIRFLKPQACFDTAVERSVDPPGREVPAFRDFPSCRSYAALI